MRPRVSEFNLIEVCFTLFNTTFPARKISKKNVGCILMYSKFDGFLESNKWNSQHYLWSFFWMRNLWRESLGPFCRPTWWFGKPAEVLPSAQEVDEPNGSNGSHVVVVWFSCWQYFFCKGVSDLVSSRLNLGGRLQVTSSTRVEWREVSYDFPTNGCWTSRLTLGKTVYYEVFHLTSLDLLLVKGKQPFLKEATTFSSFFFSGKKRNNQSDGMIKAWSFVKRNLFLQQQISGRMNAIRFLKNRWRRCVNPHLHHRRTDRQLQ